MDNSSAVAPPRFRSASLVIILLSPVLLMADLFQSFAQAQPDAGSISDVFFQVEGLDTSGNPIDELIGRLGFSCITEQGYHDELCPVERRLATYVNSLPHGRKEMTEALTALGANCSVDLKKPVDCIYRKRTRTSGWMAGEVTPRWIMEDIFVVRITAAQEQPFAAKVELNRIVEKIR